ncbi:hypothetical protein BGAL_0577g00010 [Botrytis galanthina]|uniref:Uncharacterized protein n=1 Tax=Botrytis galanthina TaxID=278940 RepID=A0A4V4HTA5_9HELO|nr:hypothetical protein BGAL_0577g00010 [Botrytis galanthina]
MGYVRRSCGNRKVMPKFCYHVQVIEHANDDERNESKIFVDYTTQSCGNRIVKYRSSYSPSAIQHLNDSSKNQLGNILIRKHDISNEMKVKSIYLTGECGNGMM